MVAERPNGGVRVERHVGWRGDNAVVEEARRPLRRRVARLLQVDGLPATAGLPSERRIATGVDPRVFYTYPLLFYTAFPRVSLAQLRALSVSGSYLFDYVLALDEVLDRPSARTGGGLLLGGLLQREALHGLYALLPPASPFWDHFDRYFGHFCQAVLREEARHRGLLQPYSTDELELVYAGKSAIAKGCLAALAVLGGDERPLAGLEASHDAHYVAFQLADDLADWRIDYRRGHYSYPLTVAFLRAGWQQRVESAARPPVSEVAELLAREGVVEEVRALALDHLDRAEGAADRVPEGSWHAAIRTTRQRIAGPSLGLDLPTVPPATAPHGAPAGPAAEAGAASWRGDRRTPATPVAASWRPWLDAHREPRTPGPAVLAEQFRSLAAAGPARTTGEALCQVGLAIAASRRALPQYGLAEHLGLSAAELDWLDQHRPWLDGLLALGLDEPPEPWRPGRPEPSGGVPGWVPPAVGRYLGHRLVKGSGPGGAQAPDVLLRAYRAESVA
ncbi:class 1 isoprenoid biosynthesis enzyme [Kitasatospora sp. NPDC036755]|uniref:class 1 isoprenoid biosynthesis enzyme n=1 Tax=Kitasatospora sp. NPDC036755 TaxID=3154600 RepID=UPI003402FBEA